MNRLYPIIKRALDVVVATGALMVLAPLLLPIAIALRLTAEGWVFYKQERIGYKNRPFEIWKFATMLKDSPNMAGGEITLRNDSRITPVGKYLRITKLNEIPQLINVLRGDMTLVGPRPLMPVSFEQYPPAIRDRIYESKPGITGIGSVIFRDEEKLVTESGIDPRAFYRDYIFGYKAELEMWYQEHKSLRVDLVLLLLTAAAIFIPSNTLPYKVFRDLPVANGRPLEGVAPQKASAG
jgi:lipopolysaccharide/colanic/teichoic acid biosynthesis glycosyltransferase